MPEHEEHCLHSEKRYGVRGDEIHAWMDEPSGVAGGTHRRFRHGLEDLPTAIQAFGTKYGAETVENIFLDHLKADSEEERKNKEVREESSLSPRFWTKEQDKYLIDNRRLSNEELEERPTLKGKTKSDISKRKKYLGIIIPKASAIQAREVGRTRLQIGEGSETAHAHRGNWWTQQC